jgi:type IV secretion system protein VirD4
MSICLSVKTNSETLVMKDLIPIKKPLEPFLPHYLDSFSNYVLGCFRDASNLPNDFIEYPTDKHLLSIAPTRTGKGRGLILPNLLSLWDHSVFVVDPKGENALVSASFRRRQGHEILIFNPHNIFAEEFAKRGFKQFQNFNPLANLDPKKTNFTSDVDFIADALIYSKGEYSHWNSSARALIAFLITFLVTQPGEEPTLRRLHSILSGGHKTLKEEVLDKADKNTNSLVYESVGRYLTDNTEVLDIIATAQTQTVLFKNPDICQALDGQAFDFEQMKNRKISVYLILPSKDLIIEERYLRLVLMVAMSHFMRSAKGNHHVLMMLDEFANLGPLSIIEKGYGLIAGHGVTLWSFVQNLTQLKNLYPENWEAFIANSSVVTVSNVNDVTTTEYFSRRAGQHEVNKTTENKGYSCDKLNVNKFPISNSTSTASVWEDSLPVSKFYNANPDTLFLFYEGQAEPTKCQKLMYDKDMPFASRADENPMHVEKSSGTKKPKARTIVVDKRTNQMKGYK